MLDFVFGFIIGGWLAWRICKAFMAWSLHQQGIKLLDDRIDAKPKPNIDAVLEEHDGVFFVWSTDPHEFLGQGRNLDELVKHIETNTKKPVIFTGDKHVGEKLLKAK